MRHAATRTCQLALQKGPSMTSPLSRRPHGLLVAALAAATVLCLPPPAQAQLTSLPYDYDTYYPIHAKGFVNNAFDSHGIDNVNLFNGDLALQIPLGPPLHPGGDLRFQLALTYNSKIWATDPRCPDEEIFDEINPQSSCTTAGKGVLVGPRYAGLGWSLELGHMAGRALHMPDGTRHEFYRCRTGDPETSESLLGQVDCADASDPRFWYTRDGSNLRREHIVVRDERNEEIVVVKNLYRVYFPDGSVAEYGFDEIHQGDPRGANILTSYLAGQGKGRDYGRGRDGFYCRKMTDKWGNSLEFEYSLGADCTTDCTYLERVTDTERRQLIPKKITEVRADGSLGRWVDLLIERGGTNRPYRITAVEFHDSESAPTLFLRYSFTYHYIDRVHLPDYTGYDLYDYYDSEAFTETTYFLDRVQADGLGIAYDMGYYLCGHPEHFGGTCDFRYLGGTLIPEDEAFHLDGIGFAKRHQVGTLREVTLPTGGRIEYDYAGYKFQHLARPESGPCPSPACSMPDGEDPPCIDISSHGSLGVASRAVYDGTELLEWTEYNQGSDYSACEPLQVDMWDTSGDHECSLEIVSPLGTDVSSVTHTTVTRHLVADAGGDSRSAAFPARDDRSVYTFSLGTFARDADGDMEYDPGERRVFPLYGALLKEEHFRGASTLLRTTAYAYTADDGGLGHCFPTSGGVAYDNPAERTIHTEKRAAITYYHDPANPAFATSAITTYEYETDGCLPLCDGLFPNNTTAARAQDTVHDTGYDWTAPLALLDGAPPFDRTSEAAYWFWQKGDPATDPDPRWVVGVPSTDVLRDLDGSLFSHTSSQCEVVTGIDTAFALTSTRVHETPGQTSNDDVVTAYEYITNTADPGYGQPGVTQVGYAPGMSDDNWRYRTADDTTFLAYDHGVAAKAWKICLDHQECPGWPTESTIGEKAERQTARTISSDLRQPTSSIDANGDGLSAVVYDAIGRVTHLTPTSAALAETTLSYPSTSWTWTEVSVEGSSDPVATYYYDGLGRLEHVQQLVPKASPTDPTLYRHKTFRYDGAGNLWRESDWLRAACYGNAEDPPECGSLFPDSYTLTPTYDPFGRPERVEGSGGSDTSPASLTSTFYTGVERVETILSNLQNGEALSRTITHMNARGNPIRVYEDRDATTLEYPSGTNDWQSFIISEHNYDLADRLTQVDVTGENGSSAASQTRTFGFDARGFATSEHHPELGQTVATTGWLATGQPLTVRYQTSQEIFETDHDAAGRPLRSRVTAPGKPDLLDSESTYGSDQATHSIGKLVGTTRYNMLRPVSQWSDGNSDHVEDSAVAVTHRYDYYGDGTGVPGLLKARETDVETYGSTTDKTVTFSLGYDHDMWGNVAEISYPDLVPAGCLPATDPVLFQWGVAGLQGVTQGGSSLVDVITYNQNTALMTRWRTPAGWTGDLANVDHYFTVDGTLPRPKGLEVKRDALSVKSTGEMVYNSAGNVTNIGTWEFEYDDFSRLTSSDLDTLGSRAFAYDDFGNLTSSGGDPISVSLATNRLNASGYSYDSHGNLTTEPMSGFVHSSRFDLGNRLVATWSSSPAAPDVYGFAYDAAGERVVKYRYRDDGGGDTVQEASFFIRDEAGNVLTEVAWVNHGGNEGIWQPPVHYLYLGRTPVLRIEPQSDSSRRYVSLFSDHLGSTRAEIKGPGTGLQAVTTLDYWPYGEIALRQGDILTEKHLFTAHEREFIGEGTGVDAMEGLDYMHQREYTHRLGRFLSLDPVGGNVGSSQSWNRYSYVRNNPANMIDPDGQASIIAWIVKKAKDRLIRVKALHSEQQVARAMRQGEDVESLTKQKALAGARAAGRGAKKPVTDKPHPDRRSGSTEGRQPHAHEGDRPERTDGRNSGQGSHNFWQKGVAVVVSLLPGSWAVDAVEIGQEVVDSGVNAFEERVLNGPIGLHREEMEEDLEQVR